MSGCKGKTVGKKVKKINCSSLLLCEKVLLQHLLRSQYVSMLWINALELDPTMGRCPTNYGWKNNGNGYFIPHWFDGESLPQKVNTDDEKTAETVDEGTEIREDDAENYGDHDAVNCIEGEYDADTDIEEDLNVDDLLFEDGEQSDDAWSDDSESEDDGEDDDEDDI
ncbi:hypothetical protein SNE40_021340 [Patella caerulea]|uniref:Uncharacterized protein n=1 Tax=Patella caerulea TaxID=87958 RepID=A0AAN8IXE9_PATCE